MVNIIVGLLCIILGLWGIAANWYQFLDLLRILLPLAILVGGVVALTAGIGNFSGKSRLKKAESGALNGGEEESDG